MSLRVINETRCVLGEGPIWSQSTGLWWVDIKGKQIHNLDDETRSWDTPIRVSALGETTDKRLICATENGLAHFDPSTGGLSHLLDIEPELPHNRSNDGKVAPDGSFWFGTMDDEERAVSGALYRYDGQLERMLDDVMITNTLAWDQNRHFFYFADSAQQIIWRFRIENGSLTQRETFVSLKGTTFYPDGSCIDSQGALWNAQWDASRVVRYLPNGEIDSVVELPTRRPTSCCLGGKDGKTLFITTASIGCHPDKEPHSGKTFAVDVEFRGTPQTPFTTSS